MLSQNIRHVNKKEIPVLASFLAETFINNDVYINIFPNSSTRKKSLTWLFKKNLLLQNAEKNTWVMLAGTTTEITNVKNLIATVTFLPSAEKKSTIADYIQKGILAMPFKFGFRAFKNLLKANKVNESVQRLASCEPFWYVGMVAVAAPHRRKGIAGQLITDVIQHNATVETFNKGYSSILLTTQTKSNLSLYNKLGFVTMGFTTQDNYTIWGMKKDLAI